MKQNLQQIKKAKSGDAEAFALLYSEIYTDLYRFALYALKNRADAEDAVSETVMDAFTSIHKLRRETSFFKFCPQNASGAFRRKRKWARRCPKNLPTAEI